MGEFLDVIRMVVTVWILKAKVTFCYEKESGIRKHIHATDEKVSVPGKQPIGEIFC